MILFVFLLFCPFLSDAQREKHFLHYKFTALSKADSFPEFSAVIVADDIQIAHYSNEEVWTRENLTVYDWITIPEEPPDARDWFIDQLKTLSDCKNSKCSDLHFLQRIIGCELQKRPDGTVKSLTAYDEYGFDGEDFISFNSDTMKWIDKNPKAKETKEKWDHQTERNKFIKLFLKTCMHWISMFHITKTIPTNVRAFVPKVSAVESNLVLTCLATGFYSRDVQMYIRLNRNILEDQTSSGIRSNGDETFQMRISVKINGNHQGSYDCLFIQNSLTLSRQVLTLSDGRCFNCEMDPSWSVKAAITAVLAPVLTIVILCCIFSDRLKSVTTISYNPPNTIQPYQHSTPPKLKPNLPPWME